jgi:hypothetical protein
MDSYAAFVTAEHEDAAPLFKWDNPESRNPVNWYLYVNGSAPRQWGLPLGWVDVLALTKLPCHWHGEYPAINQQVMFVLRDARDQRRNSLALFPETLRTELHEVRATLEAYSRTTPISSGDGPELLASGFLFGQKSTGLHVRACVDNAWNEYLIDRWD